MLFIAQEADITQLVDNSTNLLHHSLGG